MAAALKMPPAALLDSDDEVLEHLIEVAGRERTHALWQLEVSAVTAELVHALWRLTVQVNSKKGARPPTPLRVPRPWQQNKRAQARAVPRITLDELGRRLSRERDG